MFACVRSLIMLFMEPGFWSLPFFSGEKLRTTESIVANGIEKESSGAVPWIAEPNGHRRWWVNLDISRLPIGILLDKHGNVMMGLLLMQNMNIETGKFFYNQEIRVSLVLLQAGEK